MKFSSIFSFETLGGIPFPTRAAWLALLLVAAARVALSFASDALFLIPENDFDKLYLMNEAQYRLRAEPTPTVIVMGTSRLGILSADCLAGELGVEPKEVSNYALAGNSFWRTLAFFRRNPEILSEAEVVVMDLLPYQLYRGRLFTESDELFLRLATAEERARVGEPVKRLKAFADLALPVWSERHNPDGWRQGLIELLPMTTEERYQYFLASVTRGGIDLRREEHEAPAASTPELGRGYAPAPLVSRVQTQALADLTELLPEDCVLVLAWLPVREDFAEALVEDPEMKASYGCFKEFVEGVESPRVKKLWLDNEGGKHLGREDFTDVVHYSDTGIAAVCGLLGGAVREARAGTK